MWAKLSRMRTLRGLVLLRVDGGENVGEKEDSGHRWHWL